MIDFTLIGTAATMPLPKRALSCGVLRWEGRTILFDCGEGTQSAARKAHVSLMKTDLIALTHYHGDHIFGLPGLMQSMNCLGRTDALYITGPEGIEDELAPILNLAGDLQYDVKLITGDIHFHNMGKGAVLSSFPTEHRVPSCGYVFSLPRPPKFLHEKAKELGVPLNFWRRLQNGETVSFGNTTVTPQMVTGEARKGLRVVFSGDTAPCGTLAEASIDADLLVCDATYGEDGQSDLAALYGHSTFSQAAELASKANVHRLWLTHFSQTMTAPENYIINAQRHFPTAECGFDGKTIELVYED